MAPAPPMIVESPKSQILRSPANIVGRARTQQASVRCNIQQYHMQRTMTSTEGPDTAGTTIKRTIFVQEKILRLDISVTYTLSSVGEDMQKSMHTTTNWTLLWQYSTAHMSCWKYFRAFFSGSGPPMHS